MSPQERATSLAIDLTEQAMAKPKRWTDADVLHFPQVVAEPKIQATPKERREISFTDRAQDVIDTDGWESFVEMMIRLAEGYRSEAQGWNWDQWNARVYALMGVLEAEQEGKS